MLVLWGLLQHMLEVRAELLLTWWFHLVVFNQLFLHLCHQLAGLPD